MVRFGFFQSRGQRIQRYQCKDCRKCLADTASLPLDNLRVPMDKAVQVVEMLVEGIGIRAISRLTSLHQQTVLNVLELAGGRCAALLDKKIVGLALESVQVDEVWSFVGCKQRNNLTQDPERGDQYVFMGMDADSKLILNFHVGKRDDANAQIFLFDLRRRIGNTCQITTDGFGPYFNAVPMAFGNDVHYAQLIKVYGITSDINNPDRRYSPSHCVGVRTLTNIGWPIQERISTSFIERTNLSVRLFNRRLTRLTLGYSKKLVNLRHSIALLIAHFNFCRVHSTVKKTPAMAAGITDHRWTIAELLAPEPESNLVG